MHRNKNAAFRSRRDDNNRNSHSPVMRVVVVGGGACACSFRQFWRKWSSISRASRTGPNGNGTGSDWFGFMGAGSPGQAGLACSCLGPGGSAGELLRRPSEHSRRWRNGNRKRMSKGAALSSPHTRIEWFALGVVCEFFIPVRTSTHPPYRQSPRLITTTTCEETSILITKGLITRPPSLPPPP